MPFESVTDDKIADLLSCPKKVVNANARVKSRDGHEQFNYKAIAQDASRHEFEIYN
jgi:hypothetical protein